ncbi:50S ribosomal protein L20 [Patescibacteria group bacterium]|nr:50S ribosomal protein L20 [Patescibacteria group bacterium]
MTRVKRGVTAHKRHKRLFKQTKGYSGLRRHSVKKAREALLKAWTYAYRDRRTRKRDFRRLWIQRINAGARQHGLSYSQFMYGLKNKGVELDRKILAEMAYSQPEAFAKLCEDAKKGLEQPPAPKKPATEKAAAGATTNKV